MVTIKNESLIIEIMHPCPEEVLKEIQRGIINLIQSQAGSKLDEESTEDISAVLELLKQSMI